jgi:hypothetical protein
MGSINAKVQQRIEIPAPIKRKRLLYSGCFYHPTRILYGKLLEIQMSTKG